MTRCLFCRIIDGEMPADIVHQDEEMVAIRDINPQAPVHLLVIPRVHIATLDDLGGSHDELIGKMVRRAAVLAAQHGVAARGYRTLFNCGPEAGQSVYHIHLHVLGGRHLKWPPG